MEDSEECFICLCGDEEVGKGELVSLTMINCGCSPHVHSACLIEWYTGAGADGRDICPVCRTSGRIQGISEMIRGFILPESNSHGATTSVPEDQERYQIIPNARPDNESIEREGLNQKQFVGFMIILILLFVFIYSFSNTPS